MSEKSALALSIGVPGAVAGSRPAADRVVLGAGSVVMVQASRVRLLATAPVIGRGFASTVVTQAVTGRDVLSPVVGNPVGTVSVVPGGLFDLLSEWVAGLMTRRGTAAVGQEGTA